MNKHLYCTSEPKDQDQLAIVIPFSAIQCVIDVHEEQQSYLEISCDMKKHPCEEEDFYNKNQEEVAWEIKRLKRPCLEDT